MITRIDLNGAQWTVRQSDTKKAYPAVVPGVVQQDLLRAKAIPDPFYRDNEKQVQWVGEKDWVYERVFDAPDFPACSRVVLRCEGLDTLATVILNGKVVGKSENMHCCFEFDVKGAVKKGKNTLAVIFSSPFPYITEKAAASPHKNMSPWSPPTEERDRAWLRKAACHFGWDWGPVVVTAGIWRPISIVACDAARIADVTVLQAHGKDGVTLDVGAEMDLLEVGGAEIVARVKHGGKTVDEARAPAAKNAALKLRVKNPRLWWPNGLGEQPLYHVEVEVVKDGAKLDAMAKRVGLRTLGLVREKDEWGESFKFACNGAAFFGKGANWIPGDSILTRMTRKTYADLLGSAAAANMNMLRVWGGGIYEQDWFYELCDELGICVWQDCMFACSRYPVFNAEWMDNVKVEIAQNVKRLATHASLALICGNNELEQGLVGDAWTSHQMSWADYGALFDVVIRDIAARHAPQASYWPGSPHTPPPGDRKNFNDPVRGDGHLWDVWHGNEPFEWYRTSFHRFCSEFGFQSFPEPRMIETFTQPGDRNVTSAVMEHHQRSGIGNSKIMHYMLSWYRMPVGWENTVWLSQLQQGMSIKYAVEHWRRNMPRCMGATYWQINDCWPVASWASLDYAGRWKALHHMARRFFAPLLVSIVENPGEGLAELHVTSDLRDTFKGRLEWRATLLDGAEVRAGSKAVKSGATSTACASVVKLGDLIKQHGAENLIVWASLFDARGARVAWNVATLVRPKHMPLPRPKIKVDVKAWDENSFSVTLSSKAPVLWVWLALKGADAQFDDNFTCLEPNVPLRLRATPKKRMTPAAFKAALDITTLWDTYQEK
ncbi:MAG: glycoside hydrolase family 2 protein [Kiritimatiellaeota bacterium]|nr:glycoside hydrolase family 2 protein [Kiritimatiellota bacterium]